MLRRCTENCQLRSLDADSLKSRNGHISGLSLNGVTSTLASCTMRYLSLDTHCRKRHTHSDAVCSSRLVANNLSHPHTHRHTSNLQSMHQTPVSVFKIIAIFWCHDHLMQCKSVQQFQLILMLSEVAVVSSQHRPTLYTYTHKDAETQIVFTKPGNLMR